MDTGTAQALGHAKVSGGFLCFLPPNPVAFVIRHHATGCPRPHFTPSDIQGARHWGSWRREASSCTLSYAGPPHTGAPPLEATPTPGPLPALCGHVALWVLSSVCAILYLLGHTCWAHGSPGTGRGAQSSGRSHRQSFYWYKSLGPHWQILRRPKTLQSA